MRGHEEGEKRTRRRVASFHVPESLAVLISPFDRTATQEIIDTLRECAIGVNATEECQIVGVVLAGGGEESRKEYVRQRESKAEDGRVSVRGVRRKAKDQLDRLKKDGEASEDDVECAEKHLDSTTKAHTEQIDKMLATKESELLTI